MTPNVETGPAVHEFRKRALKKIAIGALGCLVLVALVIAIAFAGYLPSNPIALLPFAIPFVYFCVGTIEFVTARPYRQLADAWMGLKGWQRGVIGTLIVLVAGFIIMIVATAIVMWFT